MRRAGTSQRDVPTLRGAGATRALLPCDVEVVLSQVESPARGARLSIPPGVPGGIEVHGLVGSGIKLILNEWDTAAGYAIAVAAGKSVTLAERKTRLKYNKENLLNPYFIVH